MRIPVEPAYKKERDGGWKYEWQNQPHHNLLHNIKTLSNNFCVKISYYYYTSVAFDQEHH